MAFFRIHRREGGLCPSCNQTIPGTFLDVIEQENNRVLFTIELGPNCPKWLHASLEQLPFYLSLLKRT